MDIVHTVIFDYANPHCDLDPKYNKPIFSYGTLTYYNESQYQVWLQKVQQLSRYRLGEQSLEF